MRPQSRVRQDRVQLDRVLDDGFVQVEALRPVFGSIGVRVGCCHSGRLSDDADADTAHADGRRGTWQVRPRAAVGGLIRS